MNKLHNPYDDTFWANPGAGTFATRTIGERMSPICLVAGLMAHPERFEIDPDTHVPVVPATDIPAESMDVLSWPEMYDGTPVEFVRDGNVRELARLGGDIVELSTAWA